MTRSAGTLGRICAAVLLACGVLSLAQESRDTAKPLSASGALPQLPVNGLLDEGNVFGSEEEQLLTADLEDFRHRVSVPLYVVTANYIFGGTLEQYGERLVSEGLKGRAGVVVLYERGSGKLNYSATPGALGRSEDMKLLFLAGSRAAASLPETATTSRRLRAAVQALTSAGEGWKKHGILPDPNAPDPPPTLPETPEPAVNDPPPAPAAEKLPPTQPRPASPAPPPAGHLQQSIIAGLAAALLAGALLLFGFHRWQERTESRINARFHLPDVRVGRRLGSAQGGGVMAAISFKQKR